VNVRETAGGVLAGFAALIIGVSMLAVYGDTFPSHVGTTRNEDGILAVRISLCPGERVTSVEVTTEVEPHRTWRVAGAGSTVDTWVVGAVPPDGFVEVDSAPDGAFVRGDVSIRVETNQVAYWGDEVDVLNVIGGSVLFENQPTVSSRFDEVAMGRYPCDDPDGSLGTWRWASRGLLVAAAVFAIAAALLVPVYRRRARRADGPAGWYANPDDSTTVRWWDGNRWTVAVAVPGHTSPNRFPAVQALAVTLIVTGFLLSLVAPAAGAEHRLVREAPWVAALHRVSLGLLALGACFVLVGFVTARRKN
jgi:Protein of unknown function (DUF2510)